jgi:glycosyltransferase involved in cell wall biosynthesis
MLLAHYLRRQKSLRESTATTKSREPTKRLRVLQFGRFNNAEQNGGIERHMQLLCQGLTALDVDVTYLVAGDSLSSKASKISTQFGEYDLVEAATFGTHFSTAASPMQVIKALMMHRQKPYDIVHLHLPNPLAHLTSILLPKSVKCVITWHSDIVKQKRLLSIYLPFLRKLVSSADAVIAATPAHFSSSTQIPADYPATKRLVIPYGRDFSDLALTPATTQLCDLLKTNAKSASTTGRIIFALGRHVYYKGFDVLIEAMRHVDAQLILGGDGPLKAELQQQAERLGLSHKVIFTGSILEADLAAYFNACDVFCLPSVAQSEAFGLVQLEAMACGKPVVCTQLNNGVNVVNQAGITGLAVPVRDVTALATALNQLLTDDALRLKLGEQAKAHAINGYSLTTMATSHRDLYHMLLST